MGEEQLVSLFATLVGLIASFKQERGAGEQLNHQKFIEWLDYHRHEEIKALMANNFHLSEEVDTLLRKDHQDILQKLSGVDHILATILSRLDDFAGLTHAILPGVELSEQALSILARFYHVGARLMILMPHTSAGPILCFSPGSGVDLAEPLFIEDDLHTLVALGFLAPDYNSDGEPLYKPTRAGAQFVKMLRKADA